MGMEHVMHIIGIKVSPAAIEKEKKALENSGRDDAYSFFFERAVVVDTGFLEFTASEDGDDPYCPFEDTNTVDALRGKWYEAEEIAEWLKKHVEMEGGQIIFHSLEGDGEALGWEFDGKGKMRKLELSPVGDWE